MKKILASLVVLLLAVLLLPGEVSAADDSLQIQADTDTIYVLGSQSQENLAIPDTYATSIHLSVPGANEVTYSEDGDDIAVTEDGVVTAVPTYWKLISVGEYSGMSYYQSTTADDDWDYYSYKTGTYTVYAEADGHSLSIDIQVIDYADAFADAILDAYIAEKITDDLTTDEIMDRICAFPAQYPYNPHYSSATSMIIHGGGDCWASTDAIVRLAEKLGYKAHSRYAGYEPGAGSGHYNAVVSSNGIYYILEAGYNDLEIPRLYHVARYDAPYIYSIDDSGVTIQEYLGHAEDQTELVIPSQINGVAVTTVEPYLLYNTDTIQTVVISETVVDFSIDELDSQKLKEIRVASGNTVYCAVDGVLFDKEMTTLILYPAGKEDTEYTVPNGVHVISPPGFTDCDALVEITLPGSLANVGEDTFYKCDNLTTISIAEDNPVYRTEDGVLFDKEMTTLIQYPTGKQDEQYTIPDGITAIGRRAFIYNHALKAVTVPDSLTTVEEEAFFNCEELSSITLPDGVCSMGEGTFAYCYALTGFQFPEKMQSIPTHTFFKCKSLADLSIREGITEIGEAVFYGCDALSDIHYSGTQQQWEQIKVNSGDNSPFWNATAHYHASAPCYGVHIPGPEATCASGQVCMRCAEVLVEIGDHSYEGGQCTVCGKLSGDTSGKCGEDLTWTMGEDGTLSICGTGDMYDYEKLGYDYSDKKAPTDAPWYLYSPNIRKVEISDGVTSIGDYAFTDCTNLTDITIPDGIKEIGKWSFVDCSSLTDIAILNSVTYIGSYAFWKCTSLTSIVIPKGVTEIYSGTFARCISLRKIIIPDGVTMIENAAFSGCTNLASVTIPDSVTYINLHAFADCTSLTSITIPDGIRDLSGFTRCTGLTSINIPNSVREIGWHAFTGCTGLTSITIPASVREIDSNAFEDCTSLTSIRFEGNAPEFSESFDRYDQFANVTATVYYPGDNETWTEEVRQDYGGTITWVAYCSHSNTTVGNAKGPTCTVDGYTADIVCSVCGETILAGKTIPATGHIWDAGKITREPTESAEGEKTYTCQTCKETKKEALPKLDHTHKYTDTVVKPTCTTGGYTDHVCACGHSYKDNETKATGHKETAIPAVAATCTKTGLTEGKKCSTCGTVTVAQKEVPVTGHTWDEGKVTKEPTESSEGEKAFTCKSCGTTKTEAIAKLEHVHKYTDTVTAPTCTEPGFTTHTCACGHSYKNKETKATGHSWDEGKITREPTETAEGEKTYTCKTCGEIKKESIGKLEHTHKYSDTTVSPTCTEAGYTTHTCTCGESYRDAITSALGHAWDEGKITKEPTEEAEGEKTYTCSACQATKTETLSKLNHKHKYTDVVTAPTCTDAGYTTFTCACGDSYTDKFVSASGHTYADGKCTACGEADPNWEEPEAKPETTRVAGSHRFETSFLAANQMKKTLDIEKFDAVVVASGMDFADALGGSYLAAEKQAPILLASGIASVDKQVKDYIRANLKEGGTVYILGGEKAIPDSFAEGLESFTLRRLAGSNRFATNLLILNEVGVGEKPILVATGLNFADCLSASATKLPILLVYGNKLLDDQTAFLEANKGRPIYILGGTGAVSEAMEEMLKGYGTVERLAGKNRFDTSVMIAGKFFDSPKSTVLAYAWGFPDGLCGGPLAATMNAPLILTMEKYEQQAASYIQDNAIYDGIILGGEKLIPQTSVNTIFDIK